MKVIVQHCTTNHYLCADGKWTSKTDEAHDFLSTVMAIPFCQSLKITNYQIVLKFGDLQYDVVLDSKRFPHKHPHQDQRESI